MKMYLDLRLANPPLNLDALTLGSTFPKSSNSWEMTLIKSYLLWLSKIADFSPRFVLLMKQRLPFSFFSLVSPPHLLLLVVILRLNLEKPASPLSVTNISTHSFKVQTERYHLCLKNTPFLAANRPGPSALSCWRRIPWTFSGRKWRPT